MPISQSAGISFMSPGCIFCFVLFSWSKPVNLVTTSLRAGLEVYLS